MSLTTINITNATNPQFFITPEKTYKIGSTNDCDIQFPEHTAVIYYNTPGQTFRIVNMSEEQPTPTPPPEPEPTVPTEMELTFYTNNVYTQESFDFPLDFSTTYPGNGKQIYCNSTNNITWGYAINNSGQQYYSTLNTQRANKSVTTIGDFSFYNFEMQNISCPFLSNLELFSAGQDNLLTLQITGFADNGSSVSPSTLTFNELSWTDNVLTRGYAYDKQNDIFYASYNFSSGIPAGTYLYSNFDSNYSVIYVYMKTTNGYITVNMPNASPYINLPGIKITNASRYIPSLQNL